MPKASKVTEIASPGIIADLFSLVFGKTAKLYELTGNITVGALMAIPEPFKPSDAQIARDLERAALEGKPELRGYRARPLDGIWATAPYLHNGAVPNLAELLKPETERAKTFCVGTREFDPVTVGIPVKACPSDDYFTFQTGPQGNWNVGHNFGTTLSEAEKKALIEYLKSL